MSKIVLLNHPDELDPPLLSTEAIRELTVSVISWEAGRQVEDETGTVILTLALKLTGNMWPVYVRIPQSELTPELEGSLMRHALRQVRLQWILGGIAITGIQLDGHIWATNP